MAKMTKKYVAALSVAKLQKIAKGNTAVELYSNLAANSMQWDAVLGEWHYVSPLAAKNGIRGLARIRVTANLDELAYFVDRVKQLASDCDWRIDEISEFYPNTRKGTGVRCYITVLR